MMPFSRFQNPMEVHGSFFTAVAAVPSSTSELETMCRCMADASLHNSDSGQCRAIICCISGGSRPMKARGRSVLVVAAVLPDHGSVEEWRQYCPTRRRVAAVLPDHGSVEGSWRGCAWYRV